MLSSIRHRSIFSLGILLFLLSSCLLAKSVSIIEEGKSGVVVLKKNNLLRLPNAASEKTFIIRGNMNLKGKTLYLPYGSTLLFEKGRIKNGRVVFNDNKLAGNVKIECVFEGCVSNDTIYTDWFLKGEKSAKTARNSSRVIQNVFNLGPKYVIFGKGYYRFANVQIGSDIKIIGNGTIIIPLVLEQNEYNFNFLKNVFYAKDAKSICFKDLAFQGDITRTVMPDFKSSSIYGEPLIWVDKAENVTIDGCVFKDIENCTYCNKAYNYYGKKQGSCVCLWDVSEASYINCEQVNCRHDEQVWIIAVDKPIMDTKVTYTGNYIHDMTPGPNSSAFTCVAGTCLMENNKVERYNYPGSMFNVFAKIAFIRNNEIKDCYCSSVFDVCEYSYFHNDEILVENNHVDAVNSVLLVSQSQKVTIRNNKHRGLGLYYSANNRRSQKSVGNYKYWYSVAEKVLPTDTETVIDNNICDFTAYDGTRSIAGTNANYGTGEILEPQKYNNVGVNYGCGILVHPNEIKAGLITITNNQFTSINSLDGIIDKNNLAGIFPYTIKLVNTESAIIRDNSFNGCYPVYQNPSKYTCISIYNYPDVMEQLNNPEGLSRKPSEYGNYVIEGNCFITKIGDTNSFYPVSIYARMNSFRQTELRVKELVLRNNSIQGMDTKTIGTGINEKCLINGPVKVLKKVTGR